MSSIDIVVLTIYLYKVLHRGIFHNFYVSYILTATKEPKGNYNSALDYNIRNMYME